MTIQKKVWLTTAISLLIVNCGELSALKNEQSPTLKEIFSKDILTSKSTKAGRPDSVVIGNNIYVGYLKIPESVFAILSLDFDLKLLADNAAFYGSKDGGRLPTDIRLASTQDKLWYAFETAIEQSPDACLNHLNSAIYFIKDFKLDRSATAITSGCKATPELPGRKIVDDPAPLFWQGKLFINVRSFLGNIQHIFVLNSLLEVTESFTLNLSATISTKGTLSQNTLIAINEDIYLIGGVANGPPGAPNVNADIYAIPLQSDLKAAKGAAIPLITSNEYEEYVVSARFNNNKLYITYNTNHKKADQTNLNGSGWLAVFEKNLQNKFLLIDKFKINDRNYNMVPDNHLTVEVIGNKVVVFYQTNENRIMAKSLSMVN